MKESFIHDITPARYTVKAYMPVHYDCNTKEEIRIIQKALFSQNCINVTYEQEGEEE